MLFSVDDEQRKRAKTPHELFVFNIFAFHLLLTPAALALDIGEYALLLPVLLSGTVIAFIYFRGRRAEVHDPWFVMVHWKFALRRSRILLIAYGLSALILLLGWLVSLSIDQKHTQEIMFTAFNRIAIMPTFIAVLISFVLESGGINQANKGEVPDALAKRYPAPEGLVVVPVEAESER